MTGAIILGILGLILGFAQWRVNSEDQWYANEQAKKFNKDEAEKSRQWQEEQYKKYESVAAQMQQRQQAGLNPYDGITSMSVGSGSTASTSANQISPLSLPDMSVFSQLAKDFSIAEGQGIENQYQREIFEKRKEQFQEQVRSLNLNNQQQEFWNKMFEAAHFNSDGTVNADTNTFLFDAKRKKHDADKAEFEANIADYNQAFHKQQKYQNEFQIWLRDTLNINFDILPNHLKHHVTTFAWDMFTGKIDPTSVNGTDRIEAIYNSLAEWHNEEAAIHTDQADGISTDVKDFEYALTFLWENLPVAKEAFISFIENSDFAKDIESFRDDVHKLPWWKSKF